MPRRTIDLGDRAPVVLDTSAQRVGVSVTVDGAACQAAVLRRHLRTVAALPGRAMDTLERLASELFNNTLVHTRSGQPGGEVVITVARLEGRVQVKVTDGGRRPGTAVSTPHVRPVDPDRAGGWGLFLVDAEASRWGTLHEGGRTTVWFELDRPTVRG
ncbi:histidine kinase-like protein [Murinocardiopsis flavida]|uniref:Histidine kinase-like protein n=1 Tax=Murinocardiopsis flavida TaxID=645275 RepID=A0A2P8D934_9ACTN|nr:ATP-binding protein [Murinocardiopsis flavida]PSK93713.1 histidine kinase-like protein [Murinocardiopsis flavida]